MTIRDKNDLPAVGGVRAKTATKRYINVAYRDRDMAKRLGARWDPSVKRWYCPPGSALAKVYSWRKGASVRASASAAAEGSTGSAPLTMFDGVPNGECLEDEAGLPSAALMAAQLDRRPSRPIKRRVGAAEQLSFLG